MPTNDNYTLDMGANLTPTWGPLATQIEQAIELAVPNSYRGMVIADTATPTTTGAPAGYPAGWYEWQKRCLWLNTANNQLYGFDGTTWALVKSRPADASIGTSTIIDGAVTISKLSPTGGIAYQIPRINSGATALVWANATDLFNANEIAISKLGDTSVGSFVLTRNGPTKAWTPFDSATLLAILSSNEIPVDYLIRGAALQVPMVNAGGTATVWSSVVSGIADYSLPLAKVSKTAADAGKWLRIQADGAVLPETLVIPSPTGTSFASASEVAAGTETAKAIAPATVSSISGVASATALISSTGAAATLVEGQGVASVSWNNVGLYQDEIVVTLSTARANTNYRVLMSVECAVPLGSGNAPTVAWIESKTTTQIVIRFNVTGFVNPTKFSLAVYGN